MAKNQTLDIGSVRRNLAIILIGSIIAVNSVIVFSNPESREVYSNLLVNATATIALGLALIVMYRQKIYGLSKVYATLAAGLILLFVAERISTHYELGSATEMSFPSFVDLLRLIGYTFFAYHLFRSYKFSRKSLVPYWKLLLLSMLINVIAYSGSVYSVATNIIEETWMWDLMYNASYLCIAIALFWYNRFFIFKNEDGEDSGGKIISRPYARF